MWFSYFDYGISFVTVSLDRADRGTGVTTAQTTSRFAAAATARDAALNV